MSAVFIYQFIVCVDFAVSLSDFFEFALVEITFFAFCKFKGEVVLAWRNYLFADFKVFNRKFC